MATAAHLEVLVTADTARAEKGLESLGTKTSRAGRLAGLAKGAMLGLGGALLGGGFAAYKFVGAASDLNETINKINVIFGKSSAQVKRWGEQAIDTLGMSQQHALDAAAIFGVFGQSAGLTGDKLTGFSEKLVKAAADLSSFHNVPIEESLEALRSGLAGETEPLRRFGILLNDADLRNQALKMGLVDTTKNALTPQQRTLAAQALILKRMGAATGDYSRTQSGLANTTRRAQERLQNFSAHMGQVLLPLAGKVAEALDGVLSVLDKVARARSFSLAVKIAVSNAKRIGGEIWDSIREAVGGSNKRIVIPHRGIVIEHNAGLAEQFQRAFASVDWGKIGKTIAAGISAGVSFTASGLNKAISSFADAVIANREIIITSALEIGLAFFNTLTDPTFWARNWKLVVTIAIYAFLGRFKVLGTAIERIPILRWFQRPMNKAGDWIEGFLRKLATLIWRLIRRIAPGAAKAAEGIAESIILHFLYLPERVGNLFRRLGSAILTQLGKMLGWARDRAGKIGTAIYDGIRGKLSGLGEAMGGIFKGAINALIRAANSGLNWIASHWPDIPGAPGPPGFLSGGIPYLARGVSRFRGGPAIVGEQGPELAFLPQGSQIVGAGETRRLLREMAGRPSGNVYHITQIFQGGAASDRAAARRQQAEAGWQLRKAGVLPA